MADIFLSYSNRDAKRVAPLVRALERQNWSVWWDIKIRVGREFDQVIEEEILKAKCIIVIWSNESVKSSWVKNEANEGQKRGVLAPVLIDNVPIPIAFRSLEAAKLYDWKGRPDHPELKNLLNSVAEIIGQAPNPEEVSEQSKSRTRSVFAEGRPAFAGYVLLITLVVSGLIAWYLSTRNNPNPVTPVNTPGNEQGHTSGNRSGNVNSNNMSPTLTASSNTSSASGNTSPGASPMAPNTPAEPDALSGTNIQPSTDGDAAAARPAGTELIPLTASAQRALFGYISWEHDPSRPGNIRILNDWVERNIIEVEIPQLRGVRGAPPNGKVWFHKNYASRLKRAFTEIEEHGLLKHVLTWDGSFSPRTVRGSRLVLSSHTYGASFDINAKWNPLGQRPVSAGEDGSVRELVSVFEKYGFYWGGKFRRSEGCHFEIAR